MDNYRVQSDRAEELLNLEYGMSNLNDLRDDCHEAAKAKGWHDTERSVGEFIALMHSELSEALEEHRAGFAPHEVYCNEPSPRSNPGKPEGIPIELADVIIRIMDFCGLHNIDIQQAVDDKLEYNGMRSHRHGGKVI